MPTRVLAAAAALCLALFCSLMAALPAHVTKIDQDGKVVGIDSAERSDSGKYDLQVGMSESERRKNCSMCAGGSLDQVRHQSDTDPDQNNRIKRIVNLTRPARYHCGKCPTCYCYYRAWRG